MTAAATRARSVSAAPVLSGGAAVPVLELEPSDAGAVPLLELTLSVVVGGSSTVSDWLGREDWVGFGDALPVILASCLSSNS